jgi:PAS domain S-box-containing protein
MPRRPGDERPRPAPHVESTTRPVVAAEQALRLILRQAPIALWVVNRDLRLTHASADGLVGLLCRPLETVGMTLAERVGSDDPDHPIIAAHRRALAGESVLDEIAFEGHIFDTRIEPLRDEDGAIIGAVGVGLDVTDRVLEAAARDESEERYRRLVELSPEGIIVHAEQRIVFANAAAARVVGVEHPGELLGRSLLGFVHPDYRETARARIRQLYEHRTPTPIIEVRLLRADGTPCEVEIASAPIKFEGGDAALLVSRDISARKRAEAALRETHALVTAIVESSVDIILIRDLEGRYILANDAAARSVGLRREELVGRRMEDVLAPEHARLVREHDAEALAAGQPMMFEETIDDARGRRTYLTSRAPLRDTGGRVRGIITIARDISEHRALEEQLRQAQKLEAIGRLAGGIAHDFNNLLAVIKSYADFLMESFPPGDDRAADVREIRGAVDRATTLTRQLLVFSRRQVVTLQTVDLNEVMSSMERMLRRLFFEGIEVRTTIAAGLVPVRADVGQLEQVILNLAMNARDATPIGGVVELGTANVVLDAPAARASGDVMPGEYATLTVRDTGTGMDEETMSHIFEPFFTTKPPSKGTGLGLSTVYAIVGGWGGRVSVSSAPGRGTTVTVLLPRAAEDAQRAGAEPAGARGRGECILLVEGDTARREVSRRALERAGYQVLLAADSAAAMRIAREHPGTIDALVTNTRMPGLSGGALAEYVAAVRPNARAIILAETPEDATVHRQIAPAEAVVVRRFGSPAELVDRVRRVLAGPVTESPA